MSLQLLISDWVSAQNMPMELPEIVVETWKDDVVWKIDEILKHFPLTTPYLWTSYTNIFISSPQFDVPYIVLKNIPDWNTYLPDWFNWGYLQSMDAGVLKTNERVQHIAKQLFDVLKTPQFSKYDKIDFFVVVTPYIDNAFYLWNGKIDIWKALADRLDDDELAIIIGHEMGHGLKRKNWKKLQWALKLLFDREGEKQADLIGYQLAVSAGFSPKALYSVMRKLWWKGWIQATHPWYVERIVFVRSKVQEIMK